MQQWMVSVSAFLDAASFLGISFAIHHEMPAAKTVETNVSPSSQPDSHHGWFLGKFLAFCRPMIVGPASWA
jgi:hypothetical protein